MTRTRTAVVSAGVLAASFAAGLWAWVRSWDFGKAFRELTK